MDGRPSELNEQNRAVVRYGTQGDVPTPVNRFIYHSPLPQEKKRQRDSCGLTGAQSSGATRWQGHPIIMRAISSPSR